MKNIVRPFYRALGYYPANIAGRDYKLDPYHINFWRKASKQEWEPNTYKILSQLLNSDSVYFDIGAWIGPTVLHAAKICKHVVCFEPDPTAYKYLRFNIDLNELQNVTSYSIALGDTLSVSKMSSFGHKLGDSMTSLLDKNPRGNTVDVLQMPWDTFMDAAKVEKIDLLKMDIEGGEFALLPTLKAYIDKNKPTMYLSTHSPYLDQADRKPKMQELVDILKAYKTCLNDEMEEIDINQLTTDDGINNFNSYVFMD